MMLEFGLVLILAGWSWQFLAMMRDFSGPTRPPSLVFLVLYVLGATLLFYDTLARGRFMEGYLLVAIALASGAVLIRSLRR